jgi:hypothetical protein
MAQRPRFYSGALFNALCEERALAVESENRGPKLQAGRGIRTGKSTRHAATVDAEFRYSA